MLSRLSRQMAFFPCGGFEPARGGRVRPSFSQSNRFSCVAPGFGRALFFSRIHPAPARPKSFRRIITPPNSILGMQRQTAKQCGISVAPPSRRLGTLRATGIVRRIDELGRVVIPKEIRRTLRIREGDRLLTTWKPWERFCAAMDELGKRAGWGEGRRGGSEGVG